MDKLTSLRVAAFGIMFVLVGVQSVAQSPDPILGTWELNVAKSKFSPGPAPKNETRTYVMAGQDIRATVKGVDGAGKPTAAEFTMNYDEKDRPTTGLPDSDTLSLKRIDAFTTDYTRKRAGKVVITGTRTISRDGKSMTITAKGTDAKGQTINDVAVFEKKSLNKDDQETAVAICSAPGASVLRTNSAPH
jgi:hypothetical protein